MSQTINIPQPNSARAELQLIAKNITNNNQGYLGVMAPNWIAVRLVLREKNGFVLNSVTLGTTLGGSDVAPNIGPAAVPANGTLTLDFTNFLKNWFSVPGGLAQPLWIASPSWGGAMVDAILDCERAP